MASEADQSKISRTTWITQDTDFDLIDFAKERGIVTEKTGSAASGEAVTIQVPNLSEAIRVILEEYFQRRKGK